jgi:hypothetical protein
MTERMPIMGLLDALTNSSTARQTTQLAQQVARRSCAAVWHRVQRRVLDMSLSEARGYIRAHAAGVVEDESARVGAAPSRRAELAAIAREAVVDTLACEVARIRRTQAGRRWAA